MKIYLFSLLAGLLVGAIYSLLGVRSPAPPMVALVGLLGILMGEQALPLAQQWLSGHPVTVASITKSCRQHMFASMPSARAVEQSEGKKS